MSDVRSTLLSAILPIKAKVENLNEILEEKMINLEGGIH